MHTTSLEATKYPQPSEKSIMDLLVDILELSHENVLLATGKLPTHCPECQIILGLNGKCGNSTCNQNQRLL